MSSTTTNQQHQYHEVAYFEAFGNRFYGVCAKCGSDCQTKTKSDGRVPHWSAYPNGKPIDGVHSGQHPKECLAETR